MCLQPLSLEEHLRKKKEEEEALAKVRLPLPSIWLRWMALAVLTSIAFLPGQAWRNQAKSLSIGKSGSASAVVNHNS